MPYQVINIDTPLEENTLSVNFSTKEVRAKVVVESLNDNGFFIYYIPSLQVSAYGQTADEAKNMLWAVVMDDFCEKLVELKPAKAFEYLSSLGWQAKSTEVFRSSSYVDKDGLLKNFNLPEDTLIEEEVLEF